MSHPYRHPAPRDPPPRAPLLDSVVHAWRVLRSHAALVVAANVLSTLVIVLVHVTTSAVAIPDELPLVVSLDAGLLVLTYFEVRATWRRR